MAVEVHRDPGQPFDRPPHELRDGLGARDPERVDRDDLLRPGLDRGLVDLLVEVRLGARRVHAEERDGDPVAARERDGLGDPLQHRRARDAERLQLPIRDRRLDHRGGDAKLDERLHVGRDRAREAPDLGVQPGGRDQLDGAPVVVGHAREARLDAVHAERVEQAGDLELPLRVEYDADGLLPIAERRVVEADAPADPMRIVDRSGPDQVLHRTTPSGNGDSFSGPFGVIRKLSSRRRPPPCGQ